MSHHPTLTEGGNPNWDAWPDEHVVGNCRVKILRDEERKPIAVLAEPASPAVDAGASILYTLSSPSCSKTDVRPSIKAYWSARRRGPSSNKYFAEELPKEAVAVLQAVEGLGREERAPVIERVVAACFLIGCQLRKELERRDGDSFDKLFRDDARFEELANSWLKMKISNSVGARTITTARRHVEESLKWYRSLKSHEALLVPPPEEKGIANPTQTAVFKAIQDAMVKHAGIPLLHEVRDAFSDVVVEWEKRRNESIPTIKTDNDWKKAPNGSKEKSFLRLEAFDKAKNDLGFSWLPKSWNGSTNTDPSD